jgi:hypothetical protein
MIKINHDLTKILKPRHYKKWVVLNPEQTKVLVSHKSPKKAIEEAKAKGYTDGVIIYALDDYRAFVS